jgi:peptidoglycan/xylan/chitin deacetylase (PgdA/CDA1 family)
LRRGSSSSQESDGLGAFAEIPTVKQAEFFSRNFRVIISEIARPFMWKAGVFMSIAVFLLIGCDNKSILQTHGQVKTVAIETGYIPSIAVCKWSHDKKAAYTIAFDDSRKSHYEIAGPELKKRGIVGTFNLNTRNISAWRPWQSLFDDGNEIASHTWSHPMCTKVSESDFRTEIKKSIEDIKSNIKGITVIPSFTFPFGDSNDAVRRIVSEYHLSARGDKAGLNSDSLRDDEFSHISGIGVYPPYEMASVNSFVQQAVETSEWVLVYFHSIDDKEKEGPTTIPLDQFREHLDFVLRFKEELWIATQGQVASYIKVKEKASVFCVIRNPDTLEVRLDGVVPSHAYPVKLSVKLTPPSNWNGHDIVIENSKGQSDKITGSSDSSVVFEMPVQSKSIIYAVQSELCQKPDLN